MGRPEAVAGDPLLPDQPGLAKVAVRMTADSPIAARLQDGSMEPIAASSDLLLSTVPIPGSITVGYLDDGRAIHFSPGGLPDNAVDLLGHPVEALLPTTGHGGADATWIQQRQARPSAEVSELLDIIEQYGDLSGKGLASSIRHSIETGDAMFDDHLDHLESVARQMLDHHPQPPAVGPVLMRFCELVRSTSHATRPNENATRAEVAALREKFDANGGVLDGHPISESGMTRLVHRGKRWTVVTTPLGWTVANHQDKSVWIHGPANADYGAIWTAAGDLEGRTNSTR